MKLLDHVLYVLGITRSNFREYIERPRPKCDQIVVNDMILCMRDWERKARPLESNLPSLPMPKSKSDPRKELFRKR